MILQCASSKAPLLWLSGSRRRSLLLLPPLLLLLLLLSLLLQLVLPLLLIGLAIGIGRLTRDLRLCDLSLLLWMRLLSVAKPICLLRGPWNILFITVISKDSRIDDSWDRPGLHCVIRSRLSP